MLADIPGIIEGASEGKGLGLRFLRHIERNSMLLFLIPADSDDIKKEYNILLNELKEFNPELLDKPHLLAISKSDMLDEELTDAISKELPKVPSVFFSSITGKGVSLLKDMIWEELNSKNYTSKTVTREGIIHRNLDIASLKFEPEEKLQSPVDEEYDETSPSI